MPYNPYNPYEPYLRLIEEKINEAQRAINDIIEGAWDIFDWILDRIKDGWDWLMEKVTEFFNWFTEPMRMPGNSDALHDLSTGWKEDVQGTIAVQKSTILDTALATDNSWEGRGATAYEDAVAGQRATLDKFEADLITPTINGITKLADGIDTYNGAVVAANVVLVGGIGAGVLQLFGIITIPTAIATMVAALIAGIGAVVVADTNLTSAAESADSMLNGISAKATGWPSIASS